LALVAVQALTASQNRKVDSPFAKRAKDHDIAWRYGGRMDDITVQVAAVCAK
jgi:hypothetical protein